MWLIIISSIHQRTEGRCQLNHRTLKALSKGTGSQIHIRHILSMENIRGTGKSTHTRLWYDHIPGCDLMNDDNPVLRIVDGCPMVYGSPWSGKTPCYRNVSAPVGAMVRIRQHPSNSIRQMKPVEALAELLPAMSSMKWDKRVYSGVYDTLIRLISLCKIYELKCLPNAEAAFLCHDTVSG